MATYLSLLFTLAAAVVALYLVSHIYNGWVSRTKLQHIPTVGSSGIVGSYFTLYKLYVDSRSIIQEGYDKYPGGAFKIPLISQWRVLVSGAGMIEDIRNAADDQLSFHESLAEILQLDFTMDRDVHLDPYHVAVVRVPLTRHLGICFPDIYDEVVTAFSDLIPVTNEWIKVSASNTVRQIVFRVTNRLFVGLPLCRDPEYRALNDKYAVGLFKCATIIDLFPVILKTIIVRLLFTSVPSSINRVLKQIGPIFEERLEKEREHGPGWPGKPNDLISWLIEKAPEKSSIRSLTIRMLAINFAALHTTSMVFTHILYDLVAYPAYVPELREEVEATVITEGMTKEATDKMYKLDSFIRESLRLRGGGDIMMSRKVMKDFTFSNGTFVPAGTTICVSGFSTHHNKDVYHNPEQFDGFRFLQTRQAEAEAAKYQAVSLALDYVPFGTGKHACPGRYFAVGEMKAMLAHVLLTYDVKSEQEGVRPADHWFAFSVMPNPSAELMFRKRSF